MNLRVEFVPMSDPAELWALRTRYLDSLPCGQEALLESLIADSQAFRIDHRGAACGYFIVHGGDTLIEFFLTEPYWLFGEAVFKQILDKTKLRRALVKSFDALLFSSCVAHQDKVRSLGLLVRDYVPRELPEPRNLSYLMRKAEPADLPVLRGVEQDVFTHPERLQRAVGAGYVWLFERQREPLGFGILRPVVPGRPEIDVGIAVDGAYRRRGFAVYMLRDLAERCVADGGTPIAGCAEENRASRHTGERIGFVARHRLLELSFPAARPETSG